MQPAESIPVHHRLEEIIKQPTVQEAQLTAFLEAGDLKQIKARLNYLVSLGAIAKPEPVLYGRGKGGTRFFQRDIEEILEHVDAHRAEYSLREVADLIKGRRQDTTKEILREREIVARVPECAEALSKSAFEETETRCLFGKDMITASILRLEINFVSKQLLSTQAEIHTLKSFRENIKGNFDKNHLIKVDEYITKREKRSNQFQKELEKSNKDGLKMIEKIEQNEQ